MVHSVTQFQRSWFSSTKVGKLFINYSRTGTRSTDRIVLIVFFDLRKEGPLKDFYFFVFLPFIFPLSLSVSPTRVPE